MRGRISISEETKRAILEFKSQGHTITFTAAKFRVSQTTVSNRVNRKVNKPARVRQTGMICPITGFPY